MIIAAGSLYVDGKGSIKMTDESSIDRNPTDVAASSQESSQPEPRAIPFPTPLPQRTVEPSEDLDGADEGLVLTDADFANAVGHDENRILKAQNAKPPTAWAQGPGQFELLVESVKLAKWAARAAGTPMSQVEWVVAKALPDANLVVVAPALEGTRGAVEARVHNRALHFNISDLLRAAKMEIPSGYRHLFPVRKVLKSPIGPAIAINLGAKPLETKKVEGKKKKS